MQNVPYNLRDLRKIVEETESLLPQIDWTLDSLGNNFMAMLWMVKLALTALQAGDNLDLAEKNLQDALQAGDCIKKLMRAVLNSPQAYQVDSHWLQAHRI